MAAGEESTKDRPYDSVAFGKRARELARGRGISNQKLAAAMGKSKSVVDRLFTGNMNAEVALLARQALRGMGVDVASLPAIDEAPPVVDDEERWKLEWSRMGDLLYRHMRGSPVFERILGDLSDLVEPLKRLEHRVSQGIDDLGHPTKR